MRCWASIYCKQFDRQLGTSESDAALRDFWRPYWIVVLQNEYDPTSLNSQEVSSGSSYVYWFVTSAVTNSDAACLAPSSNPVECTRARVRHRQSAYPGASGQARAQGVCHEMGHTVGFGEYAFGHVGCMGGGTPNGGNIASQEVAAINYCYAFGSC